jgi:diamine N-acetyltransferase
MNIEMIKVTHQNRQEILALHVSKAQESFIESTEQSLKDAKKYKPFRPVGLYRDGELVGFAMYGFFSEEAESQVWLDRFLIDERFQGQGLGTIMLNAIIAHLVELYNCNEIFLSIYETNQTALHLYKKFGFQFNGELDDNGEKVMVKVL